MPTPAPPPQEYARIIVILILLFFLYTSPDNGPPPGFGTTHDYAAERLQRSRNSLDILNSSRWQDFRPRSPSGSSNETARYLNLTGFRESDGYAWGRLETWRERSATFAQEAIGTWRGRDIVNVMYENITGIVNGDWVRYSADLHGNETRRSLNLTEISPGIEWSYRAQEHWTRNITGKEGKIMIRVDERDVDELEVELNSTSETNARAREVAATLTIHDESSSGDGWDMRVHGVHWLSTGTLLMTTTSDKYAGIFGLPHLTMGVNDSGVDQFKTSQKLLNQTLQKTIRRLERAAWADTGNPWSSSPETQGDAIMPVPHCEFVVFAQVYPIQSRIPIDDTYTQYSVGQIEKELRSPNGRPIADVPRLQLSTVIFSPDCGFILESKGPPSFVPGDGEHLVGMKQEMFLQKFQKNLHLYAIVLFGQTLLHKMQSKETSTPSTIGRVSFYTIITMLMADSLIFSGLSLLSGMAPNLFPAALLTSFAAFMSIALGMRFVAAIWNVQEPERSVQGQTQQPTSTSSQPPTAPSTQVSVPVITATGADVANQPTRSSNLPATPATPTATATATNDVPIIVPSDQDVDAEIVENLVNAAGPLLPISNIPTATTASPARSFGATYVRYFGTTILITLICISSISWPSTMRSAWINLVSFAYLSFWVPQIRRNITRNCRKALLWKFVFGQSVLRLTPFAYFYLKADNVLFAETDPIAFCLLAAWLWIQILTLIAQEVLGPRWGLPKTWYDEGWDYHPILREDNVEGGGLPIGLVQIPGSPVLERSTTSESDWKKADDNVRSVDCAICMQILEVPVIAAGAGEGAGGVAGMLERRRYMVTPCRHIFHSVCLEGWMRFRLQCPICREGLPPL